MRPAFLAMAAALCLSAQVPAIPAPEFGEHMAKLRKNIDDVLALFGWEEGAGEVYRIARHSTYYYLHGFEEPGAARHLSTDSEVLFLPPRDAGTERYNGKRVAAADAGASQRTGLGGTGS